MLPEKLRQDTLSARENDYFSAYSKCLSDYCEDIDVDLVSDMEVKSTLISHTHTAHPFLMIGAPSLLIVTTSWQQIVLIAFHD